MPLLRDKLCFRVRGVSGGGYRCSVHSQNALTIRGLVLDGSLPAHAVVECDGHQYFALDIAEFRLPEWLREEAAKETGLLTDD